MRKLFILLLATLPALAIGDIRYRSEDPTSVIEDSVCIPELNGEGYLHVDEDVTGLAIAVIGADGVLVALYDAITELEDVAAPGTGAYTAPSAINARVSPDGQGAGDCTEIQFADAVYAGQSHVVIRITDGQTTILDWYRYVYLDGLTSQDLGLLYKSDIGTVNSQTDYDNDEAIATSNILVGSLVSIEDATNGDASVRWVTAVTAANNNVVINAAPDFTVVATDKIRIWSEQHPRYLLEANIAAVKTETALIVADTNELQVDDYPTSIAALQTDLNALRRTIAIFDTTIAALTTQVSFTLTAGPPDDDAINGCMILITDQADATQIAFAGIQDYGQATKLVTLDADPAIFLMAATDLATISCYGVSAEFMNKAEILGAGNSGDKWRGN